MTYCSIRKPLLLLWGFMLTIQPSLTLAAEAESEQSVWFWNLVISLIVMLVTLSSAALPLAALRQWRGGWFMVSAAPLAILAFWCAAIFLRCV